ncbi:hypothetical protein OV203_18605 [Nannocystis sp. ILAH1]|uniref:hypothetical protein n=1 Tax=unclassified Nannocystis TaxID=2627009 RepID=UPI002271AE2B|nr:MULTISPECIES: hypothetical protein [unclassified Nannocystis]MCY0989155.1 hypothetical protein [Nannocystis sp. ILAH1]MCY1067911.1 hypothetical protein [Nannocystis sp. RBIL2]
MTLRRVAFAAALACNPPASSEPAPVAPVEAAPPEPTCEEPPLGTLAWLPELPDPARRPDALASAEPRPGVSATGSPSRADATPPGAPRSPAGPSTDVAARESSARSDMPVQTCPWVLFEKDGELAVRPLGRGEAAPPHVRAPVPVIPPAGCRPCRWSGVATPAGPILLAVRPSADSELAAEAWLGAGMPPSPRIDVEPAPVVFTSLWFGQHGFGDSTLQGPPWALAPRLCGRSLVLLPTPRLPGAGVEEPPPALVRAAGVYAAAGGELLRQDTPVPSDMSICTAVPLELP